MKKNKLLFRIAIILGALILIIAALIYYFHYRKPVSNINTGNTAVVSSSPAPSDTNSEQPVPSQPVQSSTQQSTFAFPIDQFKERITKKPFGIYITPKTSPVQPERFTGYHTGTDIEYQDITSDVPVYVLADGKVVYSGTASGYGGVFMIEFTIGNVSHTALYGHIRPSSLPKYGVAVTKGEQLAVLGTGYSKETDGERRHLHFAIISDNRVSLLGYVQTKSALSGWIDPLSLY